MAEEALVVRGAREHNLRNIDVTIPRDRLTVITGLSGSGKSSLAFDTIYAEGQRRYVESLSAYARQFLGLMEKPDVDSIEGLSPAISIEQKTAGHNPRSTVGTVTEIYDYLRLLYARAGTPHCPNCGRPVERQSAGQIASSILTWPEGSKIEILSPLVRGRKGEFKELFETARKQGFVRAYVDGDLVEIANPPRLNRKLNHSISVVVDRLVVRAEDRGRLADSVETALKLSDGLIEVTRQDDHSTHLFSEKYGCPVCGISLPELEPRHFSFNSPFGACPDCGGLGVRREVSEQLILGDASISILEGVILPWGEPDGYLRKVILPGLAKQFGFSLNAPWGQLSQHARDVLLYGASGRRGVKDVAGKWEGIIANVQRRYNETESDSVRIQLDEFMQARPCTTCEGRRLKAESLAVTIADRNIGEVTELPITGARRFFESIPIRDGSKGVGLDSEIAGVLFPQRVAAIVTGVLGGAGLLLAAIGLYGLVSYGVRLRLRELGVRIALGAGSGCVIRLVVSDALRLGMAGAVVGLAGACLAGGVLRAYLVRISPLDAPSFAGAAAVLLAAAAVAAYLPARRAAATDPLIVLRSE